MTQDLSNAFGEPATSQLRGLLPPRARTAPTSNGSSPHSPHSPQVPAQHGSSSDRDEAPARESRVHEAPARESRVREAPARESRVREAPARESRVPSASPAPPPQQDPSDVPDAPAPTPLASRRRTTRTASATPPAPAARSTPSTTNRRWGMARVTGREHVDLLVLCALREGPASARGLIERLRDESGGILEAPDRTVHTTLHRLARNRLLHRVPGGVPAGPRYALTAAGERAAVARARQWRLFARAVSGVVGEPDPR